MAVGLGGMNRGDESTTGQFFKIYATRIFKNIKPKHGPSHCIPLACKYKTRGCLEKAASCYFTFPGNYFPSFVKRTITLSLGPLPGTVVGAPFSPLHIVIINHAIHMASITYFNRNKICLIVIRSVPPVLANLPVQSRYHESIITLSIYCSNTPVSSLWT